MNIIDKYAAIGSGGEYALGALHSLYDKDLSAKEITTKALSTAIYYTRYAELPINLINL